MVPSETKLFQELLQQFTLETKILIADKFVQPASWSKTIANTSLGQLWLCLAFLKVSKDGEHIASLGICFRVAPLSYNPAQTFQAAAYSSCLLI